MGDRDGTSDRDGLGTYRTKRRFDRTSEPAGTDSTPGEQPAFVVQIHDASSMHFDFRLEHGGVLKSWSVPKGPSTDPHDKRLALPTEDHPLEYRKFEGVIPEGEYGAGPVLVWDEGTYEVVGRGGRVRPEASLEEELSSGHVGFRLHGAKLHGDWALTRFRGGGGAWGGGSSGGREAWLLVKKGGSGAGSGTPDPQRARSARTRRTLRQVADDAD